MAGGAAGGGPGPRSPTWGNVAVDRGALEILHSEHLQDGSPNTGLLQSLPRLLLSSTNQVSFHRGSSELIRIWKPEIHNILGERCYRLINISTLHMNMVWAGA